jgi:hypothetical protein
VAGQVFDPVVGLDLDDPAPVDRTIGPGADEQLSEEVAGDGNRIFVLKYFGFNCGRHGL